MHKVIKSYVDRFAEEASLTGLGESEQFERFVNFAVVSAYFPDDFDIEDVTTTAADRSIDGVAILIGEELVASSDDVTSVFARLRPRQQVGVTYLFIQAKRSETFDAGDILKFGQGVRSLFDENQPAADPVLQEFVKSHEQVVGNLARVENGRPECRLFYATTGVWNEDSGLRYQLRSIVEQLRATSLFHDVVFEPVDRERLIRYWLQSRNPVQATFMVKNYIPLPEIAGVNEAYLALAPAKGFIENVLADEEGRIRASVFEQNVRAYLGDENPVNARIHEVLANNMLHDRFAILNNGITLVSRDVRVQSDRISVSDYQIVNGCQTSHVLFRNSDKIGPTVWLPLKVIEADDPDVVAQVVEATNSQSQVSESQFLSIRPFVRKLESYFNSFDTEGERERRLFFERRTRQFAGQDIGKVRIFDIQKLARAFASMFLDVPHLAARYPTQTFQEKADQLFQADHKEHAYYTAALALYRLELALGNQYVPRVYQRYKWHLLMIVKYQVGGMDVPALNSRKLDQYCERIVAVLAAGGKASAPPFLVATKVVDAVGEAGRDRLKGQRYTEDIKANLRQQARADVGRQ